MWIATPINGEKEQVYARTFRRVEGKKREQKGGRPQIHCIDTRAWPAKVANPTKKGHFQAPQRRTVLERPAVPKKVGPGTGLGEERAKQPVPLLGKKARWEKGPGRADTGGGTQLCRLR